MALGSSAQRELMLPGRGEECAVLDGLLEGAPVGRSGVLVLKGEAGVGKTTLLEYAVALASEMRGMTLTGSSVANMDSPDDDRSLGQLARHDPRAPGFVSSLLDRAASGPVQRLRVWLSGQAWSRAESRLPAAGIHLRRSSRRPTWWREATSGRRGTRAPATSS